MAVVSILKKVNIHVYEKQFSLLGGYKRISAFDHPEKPEEKPIIRVLYCGRNHYGKLFNFLLLSLPSLQMLSSLNI